MTALPLAPASPGLFRAYPVLYVDDEPDNLLVFRATFRDEFEVLTAGSAATGLELLDSVPVAVLLSDQRMPGMTGVELCERVRDTHPDIIRMLITAYSDTEVAIDAINRGGVSRYITKPWQEPEVRQVLREAIARAHLERMLRKLRAALIDHERLAGAQAATNRLLHELASTNASIESCCDKLEALGEQLRQRVDPVTLATYRGEVGELRHAVDFLGRLRADGGTERSRAVRRPRRELLDMGEVLSLVLELARGELLGTAEVAVRCPPGLRVYADRTDLTRILLNLIRSAGRALRAEGRVDGKVTLVASDEGASTAIQVQDNGPAVPPGEGARLFTIDDREGRHGFELVIARELTLTNGGALELLGGRSTPTWLLTIPATDHGAAP